MSKDPELNCATSIFKNMRRKDAAEYLGVSEGFLEKAAVRGDGPPMLRLSNRLIVYAKDDLDLWSSARRVASTSQRVMELQQ